MAISFHQIQKAVHEKRAFSWEYSETDGYVLHGQLPYHTETKVIGHTHDWKQAKLAGHRWLCKQFCRGEQWQQLAGLISKHEMANPMYCQPKEKSDAVTMDLFGASESEGGA